MWTLSWVLCSYLLETVMLINLSTARTQEVRTPPAEGRWKVKAGLFGNLKKESYDDSSVWDAALRKLLNISKIITQNLTGKEDSWSVCMWTVTVKLAVSLYSVWTICEMRSEAVATENVESNVHQEWIVLSIFYARHSSNSKTFQDMRANSQNGTTDPDALHFSQYYVGFWVTFTRVVQLIHLVQTKGGKKYIVAF